MKFYTHKFDILYLIFSFYIFYFYKFINEILHIEIRHIALYFVPFVMFPFINLKMKFFTMNLKLILIKNFLNYLLENIYFLLKIY